MVDTERLLTHLTYCVRHIKTYIYILIEYQGKHIITKSVLQLREENNRRKQINRQLYEQWKPSPLPRRRP